MQRARTTKPKKLSYYENEENVRLKAAKYLKIDPQDAASSKN